MSQSHPSSAAKRTLLNNLTRELFQTETSAYRHSNREAERLGDTGPARALRNVAAHAKDVLSELPQLAERNGMKVSRGGMLVGELFSQARDKVADMLIDSERSYRGTLLGMHHGVDVVRLLREYAAVEGKQDLEDFCGRWLRRRNVLIEKVAEELHWFANHADEAVKIGRPLLKGARATQRSLGANE